MQYEYLQTPFVIGLHGEAGVGKDFLAKVVSDYTKTTSCIAFASHLKLVARIMFKSDVFCHSGKIKDVPIDELNGYSPRQVLLELSELKDKYDPLCLFRATKEDYELLKDFRPTDSVIFTDCRYPHEYEYMNELNAAIVNITNPLDKDPVLIPSKNGTFVFINDQQDPNSSQKFLKFLNTILKENL